MDQYGTVLESHDGVARVLVRRPGACEHCGACELGARPEQVVELPNPEGYPAGTSVVLKVAEGEVAKASLVVYVIPLLALFLGFGVGEVLNRYLARPSELLVLFTGLVFLGLTYWGIFLWDRRRSRSRCTPVMEAAALAGGPDRPKG